jgi:inhibitor of cysteine peptidase
MRLSESDSGKSIAVKLGETLEIDLESNPTTGYSWQVVQLPVALDIESRDYLWDEPVRCGSGGREHFRLAVARAGPGWLRLEYRRPWEKAAGPARTFELNLESV